MVSLVAEMTINVNLLIKGQTQWKKKQAAPNEELN